MPQVGGPDVVTSATTLAVIIVRSTNQFKMYRKQKYLLYTINAILYLLLSLNCYTQSLNKIVLKNGNTILIANHRGLYEWIDTTLFNPKSLLRNDDWYSIKSYCFKAGEPNNIVQVFGLKSYSSKHLTTNQIQAELFTAYKKKLTDKVNINFNWNGPLNLTLEKFISNYPNEMQANIRSIVDSEFTELNQKKSPDIYPTIFYESKNSLIMGIDLSAKLSSLNKTLSISSYTGFILLNNHAYGIQILLGTNEYSYEAKKAIIYEFIKNLESNNLNKPL